MNSPEIVTAYRIRKPKLWFRWGSPSGFGFVIRYGSSYGLHLYWKYRAKGRPVPFSERYGFVNPDDFRIISKLRVELLKPSESYKIDVWFQAELDEVNKRQKVEQ